MKHFYLFCCSLLLPCAAEIEFLLAVWRHGDRAPENLPYPSDPHNETFWPRGWNQLTNVGIDQATKLGKFLRRRYQGSVLPVFDRKKISIRSSDADRAIETAQSVATALFPPDGLQVWNEEKFRFWQPIPIRTNGKPDPMLRPSKIQCPAYQRIVAEERKKIESEINVKYKRELEIISNHTSHQTKYGNIKDVYNVILEHYNGLPFPNWIDEKVNGKSLLDTIAEIRRIARLQLFNSRAKAKFMAGYLINSWTESLVLASQHISPKKALLYSSHDGTLSALMYGLGISNHQLIPYTACIMIELHTGNNVKIYFRNTTTENPDDVHEMFVPGCSTDCHLSKFIKSVNGVRVKSLEHLEDICESAFSRQSTLIFAIIFVMLLIL
ncbi:Lysosomal acid phosphatase [Caenorhabditis elegans]|uniref:Lysosomal acid phosphatase n=1 Tax=Caenorhabditis elegans TaxID=6239 RepID=Q22630_CAEEL|nr:Lysosomal acid phosphatase [Caenorhabditis elegans]CAA92013.2 Lysosomal acid phosphatase [Caenorhabditis elegans]|eukprot:NP_509828.2 intestinal acid PHOsphatase [Caenorhabditis elegans]